ncbi:MAG: lipopolysaccharide biosynthesis protein [Janthinobacterium lividum]
MSTSPALGLSGEIGSSAASNQRGRWAALSRKLKVQVGSRLSYALADQVVYSFGNMVVAALLSRHGGQREFGIYILTQRSMDVLIQFCNVFLWGPFTFNLPSTAEEDKARYQGSIFCLQIAFCMLFTFALWIASRWAATPAHGIYYGTFAPLVLTGGGILFREFTRRMYFSHMRLQEAFWTDMATVFLQVAGVEWLYRTGSLDVTRTLTVLCLGAVVVSFWWLVREWRSFTVGLHATIRDFRLNLQLGRWFLGSNMVFLASSQCNPWVLSALLGGSAVGAYAVCESVVNIPRVALTSMQNVMGPMVARAQKEGGRESLQGVVRKLNRMLLFGSGVFAIAIISVGPWVGRLIFKNVPGNARSVLLLLSINLVAYAATLAQSYALTAMKRADTTFYANTIGLLAQAAVCYLLVRSFHVPGAAAAMLLGSLIVLFVRNWFFQRETAVA